MANWFKKILKYCWTNQTLVEDNDKTTYLDIGHGYEGDEIIEPNYLWVYADGELLVHAEEMTDGWLDRHSTVQEFRGKLSHNLLGRYESATGRISVYLPYEYEKLGGIPTEVKNKLYEKFPGITKFYYFK